MISNMMMARTRRALGLQVMHEIIISYLPLVLIKFDSIYIFAAITSMYYSWITRITFNLISYSAEASVNYIMILWRENISFILTRICCVSINRLILHFKRIINITILHNFHLFILCLCYWSRMYQMFLWSANNKKLP